MAADGVSAVLTMAGSVALTNDLRVACSLYSATDDPFEPDKLWGREDFPLERRAFLRAFGVKLPFFL